MDSNKLEEILDKHLKWLRNEDGGSRANLCDADLRDADLCGADLRGADLCRADLRDADLRGADLRGANLCDADLCGADLCRANLCDADLRGANLCDADLCGANLRGADLCDANLRGANLRGADLCRADLRDADLRRANLCDADLCGAKIELALLNEFYPICCPEYGSFTAWKKSRNGYIVKLEVTENAKRSSAFGRKCRCSEAKVMAIETKDGGDAGVTEVRSGYDYSFIYRVGETVSVSDFDDDRRNECAAGIHFFITRQEAVDYCI